MFGCVCVNEFSCQMIHTNQSGGDPVAKPISQWNKTIGLKIRKLLYKTSNERGNWTISLLLLHIHTFWILIFGLIFPQFPHTGMKSTCRTISNKCILCGNRVCYYWHKISICSMFVLRACIICSIKIMWLFCVHAYFGMRMCIHSLHAGIFIVSHLYVSNGAFRKSVRFFDPLLFCYTFHVNQWECIPDIIETVCKIWSTVFRDDQFSEDNHKTIDSAQ